MGATTGPKLTIPFTVNTDKIVGQGERPELWAIYSTDDLSDATPSWQDASAKVRAFSTSRGRDSELDEMDAGTATVELDNRTRTFDPVSDSTIRPGNQWWLRAQFCGETHDIFKGYAESYDQTWPDPRVDALAVVHCVDEFKRLNLELLPTMDPPVDTYSDVVQSDSPALYWRLHDDPTTREWRAVVGTSLFPLAAGTYTGISLGAIRGDGRLPYQALELASGTALHYPVTDPDPAYLGDLSNVTLECWFQKSANPGAERGVMVCPYASGPNTTFEMTLNTSGQIVARARNSLGTTDTATSTALANDTWYHLVAITNSSNIVLYVNGVQVASTAHTGSFPASLDTNPVFRIGDNAGGLTMRFDEPALYRYTLSATRIAAHYTAGTARGFPVSAAVSERVDTRISGILDAITNQAPRSLRTAFRSVVGRFMVGQEALGEIKTSVLSEAKDATIFMGKEGAVTFLDADHRGSSPYNTAQATYDDDGADLPYLSLTLDFSDAFLFNYITVTREGGVTQTSQDATSISKYGRRALSKTGLLISSDLFALGIADDLLAKYKDPFTRITSISPKMADPATASATLGLELGDRIRILRTPPGGGSRIDQSPWIQKIEVGGEPEKLWRCRLGVSPR